MKFPKRPQRPHKAPLQTVAANQPKTPGMACWNCGRDVNVVGGYRNLIISKATCSRCRTLEPHGAYGTRRARREAERVAKRLADRLARAQP